MDDNTKQQYYDELIKVHCKYGQYDDAANLAELIGRSLAQIEVAGMVINHLIQGSFSEAIDIAVLNSISDKKSQDSKKILDNVIAVCADNHKITRTPGSRAVVEYLIGKLVHWNDYSTAETVAQRAEIRQEFCKKLVDKSRRQKQIDQILFLDGGMM